MTQTNRTACIAAIAAMLATTGSIFADDFNPQPDPPAFGLIGILQGETARLGVRCVSLMPATATTAACTVNIQFQDLTGRALKSETKTIPAGQGGFVDFLPAVQAGASATSMRTEIIPCIKLRSRGVAIATSVQVFDTSSGKTLYHVPGLSPSAILIALY